MKLALADVRKEDTFARQSDEWLVARHHFSEASMRKIDEAVPLKGDAALVAA
jgi:hypothetical protein